MVNVNEEWKDVKGREGMFQVSSHGRVRSLPHVIRHWSGSQIHRPGRLLVQSTHSGGYRIVSLRDGKKHYVHKLVMDAFVGDACGRDVNHIDGNKSNNALSNLEYCNRLENVRHAIASGLQDNSGERNGMHKYSASQIESAVKLVSEGHSLATAASKTGVRARTVASVIEGRRWKCLGLCQ